jgi:hypothetical protein
LLKYYFLNMLKFNTSPSLRGTIINDIFNLMSCVDLLIFIVVIVYLLIFDICMCGYCIGNCLISS